MNDTTAPKDPEQKRDFFYIIKNKEIYGARTEDGRGIQYLYQDCDRLVNSAQITGGITDEAMLDLLRSVNGLKKLVHSIGVSVTAKEPMENVSFIFQMYGKKDLYGGGTQIRAVFHGDGAEQRIYLSDLTWKEDDFIPGQIRVVMEKPGQTARLNVRFYLNDGYYAPKINEEEEVEFGSADYKEMIAGSLVSLGDCTRLKRAIMRAQNGEEVTIAYIGGSVTQGAGAVPIHKKCYAYLSYCDFKKRYRAGENVRFIKAGVGGTPSELGVIRFERDVLRDGRVKPDIIIIEFAVNDQGDETKGDCYESLIRKALKLDGQPAVVLLFSVFADDENLQERMIPIGRHYHLPMVSIKDAVTSQFYKESGEGRVITKNQFFYDRYHPTNAGHRVMSDCLGYLWEQAGIVGEETQEMQSTAQILKKEPLIGNTFEDVRLLDQVNPYDKAEIMPGGFTETDPILQCVEMDASLEPVQEFPYNWHYSGKDPGQPYFEMAITCRALVLIFKDSGETDAACADIYVDGKYIRTADPYVNGWVHCNPMIILNEKNSARHLVKVAICEPDRNKKCTILGFGYVEA
ncbi:MAG: SGNH/GDSL hydrolase family protein [Eubacterium sp.]|nr:SGNH/GDSL hydrolase family protein [Eubacterium sp.]